MTLIRIKLFFSTLIISTLSLFAVQAQAGVDASPFEGLYVGFVTSKSTFSSTATHLDAGIADSPSVFNGITSAKSKNSYGGGIIAGYGLNYGIFYTGAEAAFIIDKGNTVYSDGTTNLRFYKSNTIDINFRGGVTLSDKALLFGLVGYTGVNLKSLGTNGEKDQGNLDYNKRVTGLQYGGGIELAFMENIAIRAEYTRARINDAVYLDGSDEFTFKPKTSRIMLSVVLHMY
ncbi:MAG: porin family protein [Kordiimonadaceae bacterium]|nr:porin family protein [Kordiimonadaceae bacterium]